MKIIAAELVIKIPLVVKSAEGLKQAVDHYLKRLAQCGPVDGLSHTVASKEVEVHL